MSNKAVTPGLFNDGWLTDHLTKVVKELRARPVELQPRLTGARAVIMDSPAWLQLPPKSGFYR